MLKLDDVDYKDTKLIELETFINTAFNEEREMENMDEVTFKVFKDGELVHEEPFTKVDPAKYFVNWRTHELPEPGTYKIKVLAEYGEDMKVREGYVRVKPSGDQS